MKIAVSAQNGGRDAQVDPRFGRAKCFIVIGTETGGFSAHDNEQNLNAPQGAGIQAAQAVVRLGATVLLTGHVGPKAFTTLQAGQITVYPGAAGTAREALEQYRAGQLQAAAKANVEGHWS